jgi:hypothetical protein
VGEGAAQHGAVEHAGQDHVVDVIAPAPHEAGVLLAYYTVGDRTPPARAASRDA